MKAYTVQAFGPPATHTISEIDVPDPRGGEVQIAVEACGINFADTLMIQGMYQTKPPFPFSPGLEVAGTVAAVGDGVDHVKVGDAVMAICPYGGLAEAVNVAAPMVIPRPTGMDAVTAAAFPIVYGTSHVALAQRANLQVDETLLVGGAAGGVGLTAVELGKLLGARVIACVSTEEKAALAKHYGADETILYTQTSVRDAVKQLTGGGGVDVVYDPVGGAFYEDAIRSLNWNARYLVIGFASGQIPELPLNRVLIKNVSVVGVFWGAYALNEPQVMFASLQTLMAWYMAGKLKPHVSQTFGLAQAGAALSALMDRQSTGKVVVTLR